ncbi:hypothetical protein HDE_02048 [Halotydeus destructor]|nr:hypothetical protein HDE_02048 [Halotydeus destructor]
MDIERKDSGTSRVTSKSQLARRRESVLGGPGRRGSRSRDPDPSYESFWANFNHVDVVGGAGNTGSRILGSGPARKRRRRSTVRRVQVSVDPDSRSSPVPVGSGDVDGLSGRSSQTLDYVDKSFNLMTTEHPTALQSYITGPCRPTLKVSYVQPRLPP